jgi:hypothetical protein
MESDQPSGKRRPPPRHYTIPRRQQQAEALVVNNIEVVYVAFALIAGCEFVGENFVQLYEITLVTLRQALCRQSWRFA